MNIDELILKIREIAKASPDFRYTEDESIGVCSYFPDINNPQGCIVGAAIRALGEEVDEKNDGDAASCMLSRQFGFDRVGSSKIAWIDSVQNHQDQGVSWGNAITLADNRSHE